MVIDINAFNVKSAAECRDDMIRTYRNELIRRGVPNPPVSPGTEIYVRFTSLANQLAIIANNATIKANAQMPDSAVGADLERLAATYGLSRKPAGGSEGNIVQDCSVSPVLIPTGAELLDSTGLRYAVSVGGTYSDGDSIPIASVDTGSACNLAAGSILRWVDVPAFTNSKVEVGDGGLTGGTEAEDDETLRSRLLSRLRNSPGSGNWSQVAELAESADISVQKAFVYPCADGPATQKVVVIRAPTDTNKEREVDATLLSTVIEPIIVGNLPEYQRTIVQTVTNVDCKVSIGLALPASRKASPAGLGGGWTDGDPFPTDPGAGYAAVETLTSTTVFSIRSANAPTSGVSQIAWISPLNWQVYRATVLSYTGSNPYTLTLDNPFVGIAVGDLICPDAEYLDEYAEAALTAFANLGPGECLDPTIVAGIFPRAYRHPFVEQEYPSDVGFPMLREINSATNVLDSAFLYRTVSTPGYPASIDDNPMILVPTGISFLPL